MTRWPVGGTLVTIKKEKLEELRKRASEVHKTLKHKPSLEKLLTQAELEDAAPFYFVLRDFIRQLKDARERSGQKLADVSKLTGIAVESLSRLETGTQTNPTWKTLGAYALAVGCEPILTVRQAKRQKARTLPG